MLNGLDLFSGIGGITLALSEWVRPVAYCEIDRYAQAVLLSRMAGGQLPPAPIWGDICTLRSDMLPAIEIMYGGFPCQDISTCGTGEGLEGKRSGLFFEILRLAKEIKPKFIFLENVPAIRTRGLDRIIEEFSTLRYDCRWGIVSAAEIGAPHIRKRWFLLAHSSSERRQQESRSAYGNEISDERWAKEKNYLSSSNGKIIPNSPSQQKRTPRQSWEFGCMERDWWGIEPDVCRVANGIPFRVDRIKCLGNGVVPAQAREAFKRLMGLT